MSSKFSLLPILRDQGATLVDAKTGRWRLRDYLVLFGLPAITAALALGLGWKMSIVDEVISAIAIITALLFGMVVFIFQLRLQLSARDVMDRTPTTTIELIDELFANVCYSIVVGFLTIAAALWGAAERSPTPTGSMGPIWAVGTAVILFFGVHFSLSLAMCLKRLTAAYKRLTGR